MNGGAEERSGPLYVGRGKFIPPLYVGRGKFIPPGWKPGGIVFLTFDEICILGCTGGNATL